jgi:hypothetical protein
MADMSRIGDGDGRARPRTRPGHGYQVPGGTTWTVVGLVLAVALTLSACRPAFDPSGPCTADGSAKGAYPELESAIPTTFRGVAPNEVNSGRTCSAEGLATLAGHGVTELRFGGGIWNTGPQSGVSLAVLTAPNVALDPAWVAEFYEATARKGKNVASVTPSARTLSSGAAASRIDVLNDESYQTVIVWPKDGRIAVALIANFIREIQTKAAHDAVVDEAVAAYGG